MKFHQPMGCDWFLALTIMSGGIFSRRTAAFVWSTTPFRVAPLRLNGIQARGGGGSQFTTSIISATLSPPGVDQIDREAQACLSIVGSSVQSACFQESIPYLDTRNCQEFRVLFVLGGPGAGKMRYDTCLYCTRHTTWTRRSD
jgi:hypothetical protein